MPVPPPRPIAPHASDELLMARYADGDALAFDELFLRYEGRVYAFFLDRTRSRERAQDLYQELFLRLHRSRDRFDPIRSFAPWLFTIAHRLVLDERRRAFWSWHLASEGAPAPVERRTSEARVADCEEARRLLEVLSPAERHAVLAARLDGVAYADLAEQLGRSAAAVRQMVSRATRRVRRAAAFAGRARSRRARSERAGTGLETVMPSERTPSERRESVRTGIRSSIERDAELRAGRAARLLLAAGVAGVLGALGATLLVSGHPFGHHPPWHVAVVSAVWAGLLVVTFALVFLGVRTPSLPLARAGSIALLGLGLAGLCGAACPDPHFLSWWASSAVGSRVLAWGGLPASAACFGICTAFAFGAAAAVLVPGRGGLAVPRPLVPAAALFALLAPGVALQSVGTSAGVLAGWLAGTAIGGYAGVAGGLLAKARVETASRR